MRATCGGAAVAVLSRWPRRRRLQWPGVARYEPELTLVRALRWSSVFRRLVVTGQGKGGCRSGVRKTACASAEPQQVANASLGVEPGLGALAVFFEPGGHLGNLNLESSPGRVPGRFLRGASGAVCKLTVLDRYSDGPLAGGTFKFTAGRSSGESGQPAAAGGRGCWIWRGQHRRAEGQCIPGQRRAGLRRAPEPPLQLGPGLRHRDSEPVFQAKTRSPTAITISHQAY